MRLIALPATANTVIRQSLGILAPNASSNLGAGYYLNTYDFLIQRHLIPLRTKQETNNFVRF